MKSLESKSGPNTAVSNIPSVFIKCEQAPSTHEKQIMKTKHARQILVLYSDGIRDGSSLHTFHLMRVGTVLQCSWVSPITLPATHTHSHTHTHSIQSVLLVHRWKSKLNLSFNNSHNQAPAFCCNLILLALYLAQPKYFLYKWLPFSLLLPCSSHSPLTQMVSNILCFSVLPFFQGFPST